MTYDDPLFAGYRLKDGLASVRRPRLRSDRGQALVELALVLPVLLMLILGIIDFGKAFNYKNDVTSLANQAARYAEVDSCPPCASGQQIGAYVKSTADSPELQSGGGQIGGSGVALNFCFPASGATSPLGGVGSPLQVTASATYNWLPGLVHFVGIPLSSTLSSSVTVRVAVQYDNTVYTAAAC